MWVFDVDGFFSVVEFSPPRKQIKPAVYGVKPDGKTDYQTITTPAEYGTEFVLQEYIDQLGEAYSPATKDFLSSHLLVRARIEEDLKVLVQWDKDIIYFDDTKADYKYRAIMTRKGWAAYLHHMASTIDYSSHVKEEMNRRAPQIPGGRYGAFSAIWNACMAWQDGSWKGYGSYTGGGYFSGGGGYKGSKSTYGTKYGSSGSKTLADAVATWEGTVDEDEDKFNAYPSYDDLLKEIDDEIDKDTPPQEMTDIQIHIAESGASFDTMRMQLKDMLIEWNVLDATFDLDNAVDKLIESYGTVDLDGVDQEDLLEIIFTMENA